MLIDLGEYDLAAEQFERALGIQPDFRVALGSLAETHAKMSRCVDALRESQKLITLQPLQGRLMRVQHAYICAICGREDEARKILKEHEEKAEESDEGLVEAAVTYSELGDQDEAMRLLQRAYELHDINLVFLNRSGFEKLRSDSRFIALKKKMGLASGSA